ncbi:MAG: hypothetical protein K9L62_02905 [Vallitaleaceae bacterium]|nr:hypothetical protein [Vallitaleaceae bacterium]
MRATETEKLTRELMILVNRSCGTITPDIAELKGKSVEELKRICEFAKLGEAARKAFNERLIFNELVIGDSEIEIRSEKELLEWAEGV